MYVLKYNSVIDNVYWCMHLVNIYMRVYVYMCIYVYMFLFVYILLISYVCTMYLLHCHACLCT